MLPRKKTWTGLDLGELETFQVGNLETWKVTILENWKIGKLEGFQIWKIGRFPGKGGTGSGGEPMGGRA